MALEQYANDAKAALNATINNSQTTLVVTSAASFPTTGNFRIIVDAELMLVTGVSGTTFTVTRAIEGSAATSHTAGVAVSHILTAGVWDTFRAENIAQGTCANLPAAAKSGRIYQATDFPIEYFDNGSSWQPYYQNRKITLPVTGDYTWTNGGGTATNTDITNGPTFLKVVSTGTPDKMSVFVKNVPTAPYVATSMFVPALTMNANISCGMCWYDGTKISIFGLLINNSSTVWVMWYAKYSTLTSFSAIYAQQPFPAGEQPMCLRLQDDNTNRIVYHSSDGINFVPFYSTGRTDFLTPTKIGMFLLTNTAATVNSISIQAAMTWLHWTN